MGAHQARLTVECHPYRQHHFTTSTVRPSRIAVSLCSRLRIRRNLSNSPIPGIRHRPPSQTRRVTVQPLHIGKVQVNIRLRPNLLRKSYTRNLTRYHSRIWSASLPNSTTLSRFGNNQQPRGHAATANEIEESLILLRSWSSKRLIRPLVRRRGMKMVCSHCIARCSTSMAWKTTVKLRKARPTAQHHDV